ncbi:unnamed protein product [Macrosiphum euphorbiae]|uniref:Uncharacterized protein n=1 Tax=Macrosiphum euphorbiae TaxID=13131 RepID=A0AAV0XX96_9HEMI|nr:unnamed protein product [Macrosiphum euphorbiae]
MQGCHIYKRNMEYCLLIRLSGVTIFNGHIKAEGQLEKGQRKVHSGLTVGVSPTITTSTVVTPVRTPLNLLKTQQQQQEQQQQQNL